MQLDSYPIEGTFNSMDSIANIWKSNQKPDPQEDSSFNQSISGKTPKKVSANDSALMPVPILANSSLSPFKTSTNFNLDNQTAAAQVQYENSRKLETDLNNEDLLGIGSFLPSSAIKYKNRRSFDTRSIPSTSLFQRGNDHGESPVKPLTFLDESQSSYDQTTRSAEEIARPESPLFKSLSNHQQNMVSPAWNQFSLFKLPRNPGPSQDEPVGIDWNNIFEK
jgi:hypothetical protein